ncbi:MAG: pseudouridine synthase [Acidimicrobiia bacterium]|nr:pseudouridine synthase [Acidimicrobiia bacterium]
MIAHTGLMSRRRAEDLIRAGRVTIDGKVAVLGDRGDPQTARITVDDVPLPVRPDLVYALLYKPHGVISTADDPQGRPTVIDMVDAGTRLYPVGRLDADSEGLILLTNDGSLTNLVTHPRYGVTKTYLAKIHGNPGNAAMRSLVEGVELEDGLAKAVSARIVDRHKSQSLVEIVMSEGRKREVRRMFEAVGHDVDRLVRLAIGSVRDGSLEPGAWRPLTLDEVRSLYADAGAAWQDAPAVVTEDEDE